MTCRRHIIICEGESEWAYLQRLQSFIEQQPLNEGAFEPRLKFVTPKRAVAKSGSFSSLQRSYKAIWKENRRASIQIWTDFDLYHRNDHNCAHHYCHKTSGIPDFHFSFHNFEDFFALHCEGDRFEQWRNFGNRGHFAHPLHSRGYLPEIENIFPKYDKGSLPVDFISRESLRNLRQNRIHQPSSNPHDIQGIQSFADFLVREIELAYPTLLHP